VTIPEHVDDISVDWLNLRLADNAHIGTIVDCRTEIMGEGVGILGEIARLHLSYADGTSGPPTLVAKCQSLYVENIMLCQMMGFYEREVNFYNQVASTLDLRTPTCHLAAMAEGGAPFVLLMEEIEGARMIDQLEGATLDDAKLVASTVAALHAAFWDTEALHDLGWLPPMNNDMYKGAVALIEANWKPFIETWAPKLPSEVIEWCAELSPKYSAMLDWWPANSPATFTHTDCRAENYLFGGSAGADAVTVLDFQLATRHVGTWDVANFLGMSVTVENRRAWEHEVVGHYHDALIAGGVTGYDFDQCWRDYRYCLLHQAWSQIVIANVDPGNERGRELLNEFITRGFQAAADNNSGELLQHLS